MATVPALMSEDGFKVLANKVAEETNSDIYLFNSEIARPYDQDLLDAICENPTRRENITLILLTEGGDPDAAYRMARFMHSKYKKFTCIVPAYCKSAGTLLVIGAHNLVMGDNGELGPVDVQMAKKDELGEWQSGLTVTSALRALHERSFTAFEHFFLTTKERSLNRVTFKTATDIAAKLTGALFAPIFQQIDPLHVGEASRSTAIALYYGVRLDVTSDNLKEEALESLVSKYPHHGFVIDRKEAGSLFKRVRDLSATEAALICALEDAAKDVLSKEYARREFLSDPKEAAHDTGEKGTVVSATATNPAPAPTGDGIQQNGDGDKAVAAKA